MKKLALDKLLEQQSDQAVVDQFVAGHSFPLVEDSRVTFVFVGEADQVSLRHWIYGLPQSIPLAQFGELPFWHCVMEFPFASRIEYKFGVGRNGHEQWIHDPLNSNVAHDPFGGNSVVHCHGYEIPEWTLPDENVPAGRLEHLSLNSKCFGDQRRVAIYRPPQFRRNRRYRLLVVHDGDDYIKYSSLLTVLNNLIHRLEIPPLIVAMTNPRDRNRQYADDPRHARHVVEELLPRLEASYPIIAEPSARGLLGASFGAVAALSVAWRYPNTFDQLFLQSGSFAFTDIGHHRRSVEFDPVVEFVNQFRDEPREPAQRVFMSCGQYESLIYENRSMVPFLQSQGIDVKFVEARDGHNWENWRDRLRDGLSWLFPGPLWVTYE